MIVKEKDIHKPIEVPVVKMSDRESKKFLIVNNHVREIHIKHETNSMENHFEHSASENFETRIKRKIKKKKCDKNNKDFSSEDTKISDSDLEELRTVYENCKAVIKKIETKYGHLLRDGKASSCKPQKRKVDSEEEECHCEKNKKIVFDEDGQEITVDTTNENHICHKKMIDTPKLKNIEIQYTDNEIPLPDDLHELLKLLQDPNIETTMRNRVIYKIKSMKQEVTNEIKFNKHSLMEQLKNNPDEILAFEGTNLSSIPGYL